MVDPRCLTLNKQQSKDVFNEPYGNFETVKTWANPRLKSSCLIDGFCGVDRGWPAHYNAIHPEPPMRHGKWWWWAGADQDGMLMSTDIAGVNYLGPIPSPAPTPPLIGTHTP